MKNDKKTLIFAVIAAAIGLIFLLLGSFGFGEEDVQGTPDEIEVYCKYLEEQAVRLCESVRGVSDVTVALTLEGGFEQVYAADKKTTSGGQSIEYVKVGSELCAVSVSTPSVAGIGVTCRGGDDDIVRAELTALLSAAFGVKANKIYITEAGR